MKFFTGYEKFTGHEIVFNGPLQSQRRRVGQLSVGSVPVDCELSSLSLETKQWAVSSKCKTSIIPYTHYGYTQKNLVNIILEIFKVFTAHNKL